MATPACSMVASRRAASGATGCSSGAVDAAGVASTTSSAGSPSTRQPASVGGEFRHRGAPLDRDTSCRSLTDDGVDEPGHPGDRCQEDRAGRSWSGGAAAASGEEQAAVVTQCSQLRHAGQAEAVGVGGVDAADQRIDEPVLHLVAEADADQAADAVADRRAPWQQGLEGRPQLALDREQAARREAPHVTGHAQGKTFGDRMETVEPHGGLGVRGRRELVGQTDVSRQLHGLRDAGEERVGSFVDRRQAAEGSGAELAAEPIVGLPDDDLDVLWVGLAGQVHGGGQPRDPASDDDDAAAAASLHRDRTRGLRPEPHRHLARWRSLSRHELAPLAHRVRRHVRRARR